MSKQTPISKNRPNMLFNAAGDFSSFRAELGLTQAEMGVEIKRQGNTGHAYTKSYISKLESGDIPLSKNIQAAYITLQKKYLARTFNKRLPVVAVRGRWCGRIGKEKVLVNMGEKINGIPVVLAVPAHDVLEVR